MAGWERREVRLPRRKRASWWARERPRGRHAGWHVLVGTRRCLHPSERGPRPKDQEGCSLALVGIARRNWRNRGTASRGRERRSGAWVLLLRIDSSPHSPARRAGTILRRRRRVDQIPEPGAHSGEISAPVCVI